MSIKVKSKRKGRTMTSRLSSKNQVTIPIDVLREAGFVAGEELAFKYEDGRVVIEKENLPSISKIFGIGNGINEGFDWRKDREESWGE